METLPSPTYAEAVSLLNSTQTGFRALQTRPQYGGGPEGSPVDQMRTWLRYLGYEPRDLDRLNVVHVSGTKGKGTTCAFTNSILEQYRIGGGGKSSSDSVFAATAGPHKIGLFTSPHLVAVRERIRINSVPLSEEVFARYFFEVWRAFEGAAAQAGADPQAKPPYYRFLTLMSFHVFLREGVDAAIYEVGMGGQLDVTNVFERPAATAVTTLGIDHVAALGATIDKIAWHKAGILKPGCPAFTVPQEPAAMDVLLARAQERSTALTVLQPADFDAALSRHVRLVPDAPFQRKNAALAVQLAAVVLKRLDVDVSGAIDLRPESDVPLPVRFVRGLENVVWRGRCETLVDGQQRRWHLDGAHNVQSLQVACQWFRSVVAQQPATSLNILIFNQQSLRDAVELVRVVHSAVCGASSGPRFQHAIFCTNVTYKNNSFKVDFVDKSVDPTAIKSLALQQELADTWKQLDPQTKVAAVATIEDAIDQVRAIGDESDGKGVDVLVTGSFHLVGGAISLLEDTGIA